MKRFSSILYVTGVLAFVLLVSLPTIAGAKGEISITTKSDEAYKLFVQGRMAFENIRTNEAGDLFAKAVEKDRDFALAYLYRAFVASSAMDYQNNLQEALTLAPKVSAGERMMIEAVKADAENNVVKQIQLTEQLAKQFPDDKRVHYYLGAAYMGQDENDKAIVEFNKVLAIDANYPPVYNLMGYTYVDKGDYVKAEEAFKNYIRLLPEEANPHDSLADLYTKLGRYDDAIAEYRQAVALNPQFTFSQRKIGDNLIFLGKYEEGREAYRKAVTMETTPSDRLMDASAIAYSYVYEGNYPLAIAECEKIGQTANKEGLPEWEAEANLANCDLYIETGSLDKAEQCVAMCKETVMASKLSPALKEKFAKSAHFDGTLITAKKKDFANAIALADAYKAKIDVAKNPKEIEDFHALLGHIFFEKGDYAAALQHLSQANQENPHTLYLLAVSESKTGNATKADELFKRAANWNVASLHHALVRSKSQMAMKREMTE